MGRGEIMLIVNFTAGGGFAVKSRTVPGGDAGLTDGARGQRWRRHLGNRHRATANDEQQRDKDRTWTTVGTITHRFRGCLYSLKARRSRRAEFDRGCQNWVARLILIAINKL